jgi:hypothetical protein
MSRRSYERISLANGRVEIGMDEDSDGRVYITIEDTDDPRWVHEATLSVPDAIRLRDWLNAEFGP